MSICQRILVDGEPVLVRVTELLDDDEIEAFSEIIRAARRKYETEHPTTEKETPMKQVHVFPSDTPGNWVVRADGFATQEDAINWARPAAHKIGTELNIHGVDGQIREKDSHGNDPKEIKG